MDFWRCDESNPCRILREHGEWEGMVGSQHAHARFNHPAYSFRSAWLLLQHHFQDSPIVSIYDMVNLLTLGDNEQQNEWAVADELEAEEDPENVMMDTKNEATINCFLAAYARSRSGVDYTFDEVAHMLNKAGRVKGSGETILPLTSY